MDQLAALLDGPGARGAFLLRALLDPPWSLRIQDEAPPTLVAMVRGAAWVVPEQGENVHLAPGEVAVIRGPAPYNVADDPVTSPQIVVHPGRLCTTPDGESLHRAMDLGVRTWGTSSEGSTMMITGTYRMEGEVSRRLLDALPSLLVRPGDPLISLLGGEVVKDEPGQEAVLDRLLDRLLDLLLVSVLRSWFATHEAPAWCRAHGDPMVGKALRMLHNNPAHPWTVADLLREPRATVASVARQVGYGSAFALSAAFKRVRGVSPQEHRAGVLA